MGAVTGRAELDRYFDQLASKAQTALVLPALEAGAEVIKVAAQENLERSGAIQTGKLRDGIVVEAEVKNGKATVAVECTGEHAFVAHWIEYGTAAHVIAPEVKKALTVNGMLFNNVKHHGAKAKPFLRPALDAHGGEAVQAMADAVAAEIEKG